MLLPVSLLLAAAPVWVANLPVRPRIVQLQDGSHIGVYLREHQGRRAVAAMTSSDNGATWSPPRELFGLSNEAGNWGGIEALADRHGELHVFLLNDRHTGVLQTGEEQRPRVGSQAERRLDIWHVRSSGKGSRWLAPQQIWTGYTGALNSVIQMKSGRILLPFSYRTTRTWSDRGPGLDQFTFMGQYNCTLVYSDDDGGAWQQAPAHLKTPAPDIVSAYGAVEPVVLQRKDGRVWMLIRTQLGRFYESFSADGATWSEPRPTEIVSSDSPAGLVRLEDGRVVLLWNNCLRFPYAYGGRHVLHAAISADEGATWTGYREVARDPKRDEPPPPRGDHGTAYPYPTAAQRGSILFSTGQGEGRNFVIRLDPEWLAETQARDDFSRGLEDWSVFGTRGVTLRAHPERAGARALEIRKAEAGWPAAAVWNFPNGRKGKVTVRVKRDAGAADAMLILTDHFSVPFDAEDEFHSLVNVRLAGNDGKPGWQAITLAWNGEERVCRVLVDGRQVRTLPLRREAAGVSYLRMKSLAETPETGGWLMESVEAEVVAR